jgi:adenine-specific DNA-methyltransferase
VDSPLDPGVSAMETAAERDVRMRLESTDIVGERLAALRDLFPEAFTEGKVDFEKLRMALGDHVETGRERYGLTWAGKADAMRAVQVPSTATLVPMREESVDWDNTQNVFIEGENLEVLKLLQKSYCGKVKMIYIDPPYNTGNEFIYPDDFRDSIGNYLRLTGQVSAEGRRLTTNTETSGRYHSNWLNMMYPRLFLARNLLRDDGIAFVSIDDHEVENLRGLMDEVFGEENFVASIIWQKVFAPKNTAQYFSEDHDYVVAYARRKDSWSPTLLARSSSAQDRYVNPDNDPRGPWSSSDLTARNYYGEAQYQVIGPTGKRFRPTVGSYWRVHLEKFKHFDADKRIWWGESGDNMPRLKRFLSEVKQGVVPQTLWKYQDVGHTQEAKQVLLEFVHFEHTENVLNSVKPPRLIQRMLQVATTPNDGDLILDFFAGSAVTAHATMLQNRSDGGNRRYICVQFPEPLPQPEPKLRTITDIGLERIRAVGKTMTTTDQGTLDLDAPPDTGFRFYRLATSNFKTWNADFGPVSEAAVTEQLRLHTDHVLPDRSQDDILFEILLKAGYPLSARVEATTLGSQTALAISEGNLIICLECPIQIETLRRAMARDPKPVQVICLDHAFEGNDQLKTNIVLEMEAQNIQFRTV